VQNRQTVQTWAGYHAKGYSLATTPSGNVRDNKYRNGGEGDREGTNSSWKRGTAVRTAKAPTKDDVPGRVSRSVHPSKTTLVLSKIIRERRW